MAEFENKSLSTNYKYRSKWVSDEYDHDDKHDDDDSV